MRSIHPVLPGSMSLDDGRTISLTEEIGQGKNGRVHRGVLTARFGLRRTVAVKIFDVQRDDDPAELLRRLGDVAARAAAVRHPSVIQTYELATTPGSRRPFLVTELVDGESLASLLAAWRDSSVRVPIDFALVVALKTAEGLAAALFSDHPDGGVTGLVHGNVCASQVLVSELGDVKIGDFGLCGLRDLTSHVRSRSALSHVAPEVAGGHEPTPQTDVFSLGMILREMLIGPRFGAGTDMAEAVRMVRCGVVHAPLVAPNLPHDLRSVLDRAIAPEPEARYPHARALAFDLRREMLRLNLSDAQTSVRHAVVGFCEVVRPPTLTNEVASPAFRGFGGFPAAVPDAEDTSHDILP